MHITKTDIIWNYAATFLKIAASALLLPFILRMMPSEMVGIWSIFMTITAFTSLIDFGFSPSFTRNITYVFSGVKNLKVNGIDFASTEHQTIDYGLLKGVISAMQWIYLRMALILLFLLATVGTFYIYSLLQDYKGEVYEVYIAWILLCLINTYSLYTLYYDSLLLGKGLVKKSKQIVIIGQSVYLIIATILIIADYGLISIISAQVVSVLIIRWLSYHSFYTNEIKQRLNNAIPRLYKDILKVIYPNSIKIGLTSLGGFMVLRSAIIIGSLYLPLEDIASYGITMQLISVIAGLAPIYTVTYQPKIVQLQVEKEYIAIKDLYIKGQIVLILTYIAGSIGIIILGGWLLNVIGSKTQLIQNQMVILAIIISFLENNHAVAGSILLTKNEVPFFKASLVAGGMTIFLLLLVFRFTNLGMWGMIAAGGFAQGVYQNWKWPIVVIKELEITPKDIFRTINKFFIIKTNQL